MGCSATLSKIILFVFNGCFFLFGAALLGIGIWIAVDKTSMLRIVSVAGAPATDMSSVNNYLDTASLVQIGSYVIIGIGAFTFLVGFLGCCGACMENKCLLYMYAGLIILILLIEITGGILAAVYQAQIFSELNKALNNAQNTSYYGIPLGTDGKNPFSLTLDIVMISLQCCGINGPQDFWANGTAQTWYKNYRTYYDSAAKKNVTALYPVACCINKNSQAFLVAGNWTGITAYADYMKNPNCPTLDDYNLSTINTVGCYPQILSYATLYSKVLIGVAIGIALIEILGVIFACCLLRAIQDRK